MTPDLNKTPGLIRPRTALEDSVALHRSPGFEAVGQFNQVGRKFERWLDTLLMQRALGPGATVPPDA